MIVAAAAAFCSASQAEAARYYQFEVHGYAEFAGVLSPNGITQAQGYDSTSTFAFDTLNPSSIGYITGGSGFNVTFNIQNGIGYISTLNTPAGPVFGFSFSLASVAAQDTLGTLAVSNSNFGYIIVPDSRYPTTNRGSSSGILYSVTARTSDVAPATLSIIERVTSGAVPETSTWAMMILGIGGIGFAMRRSRKLKVNTTVSFA